MIAQEILDDQPFGLSEFHNQTTLHPLALGAVIILCVLTFVLPRKYALIPCLVLVCFIPSAQRIVIFGLDFTLLRIMAGVGLLRVILRGDFHAGRWRTPDSVMLGWGVTSLVAYSLRRGSLSDLIYMFGVVTESLALYFMVRGILRSWGDLRVFMASLTVICAIVALGFLNEKATGRNVFSVFGGVPAMTEMREGRLRCSGAFAHPILAGCFWAVQCAYMAPLWWSRLGTGRLSAVVGVTAGVVIIVTCASSTPVLSLIAGAGAGAWFVFRRYTQPLKHLIIGGLIALHLIMEAPVWHLMSRVDLAGGSTGYHRYLLVDATISNFSEWALIGTKGTSHWGTGLFDLTNQFVLEGVKGGALRLSLFVIMISMCFSRVGTMWRSAGQDREKLAMSWGLGVGLFIHCISFMGVSYHGQVAFGWYFSIAAIVSMSESFTSTCGPAPALN